MSGFVFWTVNWCNIYYEDQLEQEIIRADREAARADREAKRATEAEAEHARLLEELAAAKRHVSVAVLGL